MTSTMPSSIRIWEAPVGELTWTRRGALSQCWQDLRIEVVLSVGILADGAGRRISRRETPWHLIHFRRASMQAVQPMQAVSSWSMPKRSWLSMVWLWARGLRAGSRANHHDEDPATHPRHEVTARALMVPFARVSSGCLIWPSAFAVAVDADLMRDFSGIATMAPLAGCGLVAAGAR